MTTADWIVVAAGIGAIGWVNWYFFVAPRRAEAGRGSRRQRGGRRRREVRPGRVRRPRWLGNFP